VGGSSQGCDSVVTLNLTINNSTTGTDLQTACNSYTWIDGNNYTASTNTPTYTIVGGSANGCDSIVTLNLTINTFASGTDVITSCTPITWIDGNNYSVSTTTPTFTIVGGSSQGCDSVVTLNLTINNSTTGTDLQTACNSYTWIDGNNYTASTNTPTFTIVGGSSQGCDSIVTLNLTINNSTTGTDVITSCKPITWIDGNNYSASTTTPTFTIAGGSVQGCDSVVTLNLTVINVNAVINATPTTGSTPLNVFFGNGSTTGMSYNWDFGNGTSNTLFESTQTYNNPGVYTVILIVSDGVCYDTAMVVITTDVRIKVPSGFTPNGDGINDALVIEGIDQFPDNKLIIYNRWGSIVFSAQPYKNNWKGQSEGKAILIGNSVTDGTFFYLLEIDKETKPLTGFIEIKTK
ncbi:MAG: gliding motility-associated C-terminal domain-containing protein, partial [Bacteroidetes bacterium]|nr:gliding motility-associated C-terminal domain-containing protein [Bacteroidota bacterium]